MDFMNILYAVLVLGILGGIFGALLAFASKIFYVEQDERIDKIIAVLPGANCGGCGYAGCSSEIVAGNAKITACPVGGAACHEQIAQIMGVEAGSSEKMVAHVNCCGGEQAVKKYQYDGLKTCDAANKVAGTPMACPNACLGYGSCVAACKFDAIHVVDGKAVVDMDKCVACGACAAACPKHLIEMVPAKQKVFISCSNTQKGADTRNACQIGCIGCTLCAKKCPKEAITITNFLAKIDYSKCVNCGLCATVCPRKLIVNLRAPKVEAPVTEEVKA